VPTSDAARRDFRTAGAAILTLQMQRGAGLWMRSDHEPVQLGDFVRIRLGPRPVRITGSCDVVDVFDEPRRTGFTDRTPSVGRIIAER
jgi:uncharacterized protein (UPF0548 family)